MKLKNKLQENYQMNKVFKLKYKSGPHGDACTTYDVELFGEQTLQDFLYALDKQEWGAVNIIVPNPETYNLSYAAEHEKYMEIEIEYKNGIVITPKSEYWVWLDKVIDNNYNNWANGGWSCMNYWIKIK